MSKSCPEYKTYLTPGPDRVKLLRQRADNEEKAWTMAVEQKKKEDEEKKKQGKSWSTHEVLMMMIISWLLLGPLQTAFSEMAVAYVKALVPH